MPRKAVDKVVLAPMRFVGDDDDVAALREHRMTVALIFGKEFLDRCEHHAAGRDRQQPAQMTAAFGLHWRLTQQFTAARKRAEQLVVEVVPVGQDDEGRVFHRRLANDPPGIKRHRQALARALGVPDDADAPIAGLAAGLSTRSVEARRLLKPSRLILQLGGAQGLGHRHPHRVELVIAGHLFDDVPAAIIFKDDEVAHQLQKTPPRKNAFDHDLHLRHVRIGQGLTCDRPPWLEPFAPGAECPDPRLDPVGNDENGIRIKE